VSEFAGAGMILSFRSRALKRFWERDDRSKIPPDRIERIGMILDRLDAATAHLDLNLAGLGFHRLSGSSKGRYAVSVSANWRITFAWHDTDAVDVDFEDYH
jgi:proteic killer suppression protein